MKKNKFSISNLLWRIFLFIWFLIIVIPILWVIMESLKTNREYFQNIWALPKVPQFRNYSKAFKSLGLGNATINTIIYVGVTLVISVALSTIDAFALTRLKWRGRKIIWGAVMLSLFLPGINAMIPQYVLVCKLHLNNSILGLIILNSVTMSAYDLMIMGGFMQSIPKSLEESAYIDGASIFQNFRYIILPLSVPGIVTISIFKFLGLYNDFMGPFIYLSDSKNYTISVNMYYSNQLMQYKSDWVDLFAGVIIAMLPSLIIYIIFQKQVVKGATLGAIKE